MLNRVVRWTSEGYELEADLRHAELIIEQLELKDCRSVVTAGVDTEVKCVAWDVEGDEPEEEELPPERRLDSGPSRPAALTFNPIAPISNMR